MCALVDVAAAATPIAGCFALRAWLREGRTALRLVPGLASLGVFGLLLTRIESAFAGRAFAA